MLPLRQRLAWSLPAHAVDAAVGDVQKWLADLAAEGDRVAAGHGAGSVEAMVAGQDAELLRSLCEVAAR